MLARLEEVEGVSESRVDWSGRRFLLRLEPGARAESVAQLADEALDGGTRRIGEPAANSAVASHLNGDERWMRAGETRELSRTEARILAERHGSQAAQAAELTPEQRARLVAALEREIAATFERIHAAGRGLPADFAATYRKVLADTLASCGEFLSDAQIERVRAFAERALGG